MSLRKLLSELDEIIKKLRYVKAGDLILSSDHNDLVDASMKTRDILYSIKSRIESIESELSGVAKALVDPSGKHSPYKTIADALKALDEQGVQAATIYIVPPDDVDAYPQVIEDKSVELKNIKLIYINGRLYPITFDLDADYWIKTSSDYLSVVLDRIHMAAGGGFYGTPPATLFYSPLMTHAHVLILNAFRIYLFHSGALVDKKRQRYTNLLWTDSQSDVVVNVVVANENTRMVQGEETIRLGYILYAPFATRNIYLTVRNASAYFGAGPDVHGYGYAPELEWKDIRVVNGSLDTWFKYIKNITVVSSAVELSSDVDATIENMDAAASKIELYGESITLEKCAVNGSYIKIPGNVKMIDPLIIGCVIDGAGALTLHGETRVFIKECTMIGDISLHIVYSSGKYPVISTLYTESNIDLSGVPSGAKVLLLSSVVDKSKINDPNNVLLSNESNIDLSTMTVF